MKKLLFSLTALVASTVLFAQTDAKTVAPPTTTAAPTTPPPAPGKKASEVAKFESESIDLGKVKQDNPATATFVVTNITKEPLIIEQASPTCGCTISDYTKEPIAPGKTGTIKATYNAKNIGPFDKHLTVKFAGCDQTSITIKGEVLNAEEYAKIHPGSADAPKTTTAAADTKTAAPATKPAPAKKTTTATKKPATSDTKAAAPKS
ncbi:MAG: DUF1573 domain-containing protein [Ferruginibacter sp.]